MDFDLNEADDDIFNDIEDTYFQLGNCEDEPAQNHLDVLKAKFGHSKFRPMQWKVIRSIIEGKKDNCVIMATGYGKSLCYQYPAVYTNKITLVVSPLISLMEDQVLSLNLANINACFLGSAQSNRNILGDIYAGNYSLVYVTPEYITGSVGETLLKNIEDQLVLVGIDEAHCVSQWGHDFRAAYRNLSRIRVIVPSVPFLAVTATATPQVVEDIAKSLKLRNPNVECTGFDRPNLQFFVRIKGSSVWNDLKTILSTNNSGSTIIYCITRKITEEIAELLRSNGLKCEAYHAGLSIKNRRQVHEDFVKDKIRIIVATIAFGMGIDKPDVRLVIHYGCSKDIESYYQEVGRAGRDGGISKCITYYNRQDMKLHETLRENYSYASQSVKNNLSRLSNKMYEYLNTTDCRRNFILKYFEGDNYVRRITKTFCCDNCAAKKSTIMSNDQLYEEIDKDEKVDFTDDSVLLLEALDAFNGKTGLGFPILLLRGSRVKRLNERYYTHPLHGKGKEKPEEWWKILATVLEHQSFIKKVSVKGQGQFANIHTLSITQEGYEWLKHSKDRPLKLKPTKDMFQFFKKKRITPAFSTTNNTNNASTSNSSAIIGVPVRNRELELSQKIRLALLQARSDMAAEIDVMPYMIASNTALTQLSKIRPTSIGQLRNCKLDGFSDIKIDKFGAAFVKCIVETLKSSEHENSIESILAEHPIPGTKLNASRQAAYASFMAGTSITDTASKLNVQISTVFTYLSECIRCGLKFTRNDLRRCGISDEIFNKIMGQLPAKLSDLKDRFPDYTWDMLRLVSSYHQVREHIIRLNIPFHDPDIVKPPTAVDTKAETVAGEKTTDVQFSDDEDISFEELDKIISTATAGGKSNINPPASMPDDDILDLENEILDEIEQHSRLDSLKIINSQPASDDDDDATDDELPGYFLKAIDKMHNVEIQEPVREEARVSPKLSQNSSQSSTTSEKATKSSKFVLKRRAVPNKKVAYVNSDDDDDEDKPPPPKITSKRNMPTWLCNDVATGSNTNSTAKKTTKSTLF